MPGGFVCSGSAEGRARRGRACAAPSTGRCRCGSSSRRSSGSCSTRMRREGIGLDDLSILGPIFVLKLRVVPPELGRKARRRDVALPGRLALLELSTRCGDRPRRSRSPPRCGRTSPSRGVDLSGEQETKTRKALEYFARRTGHEARGPVIQRSSLAGSGGRSARASARRATASTRCAPEHVRGERRGLSALRGRRRHRQDPRRADGHQAARGASNDDGLEQWRPVHEGRLPARRGGRRRRCWTRSALPARSSHASPYTLEQLIDELVRPNHDSRGRRRCTSGAGTTRSAAAWPS